MSDRTNSFLKFIEDVITKKIVYHLFDDEVEFLGCVFLSYLLALEITCSCFHDFIDKDLIDLVLPDCLIEDEDFIKRSRSTLGEEVDHYIEPTEFEIQEMNVRVNEDPSDGEDEHNETYHGKITGRPKKKRIRASRESNSSTKISRVEIPTTCYNCGQPRHNKKGCKNETIPKPPKFKEKADRLKKIVANENSNVIDDEDLPSFWEGNFGPQISKLNADLEQFHLCLKEEMVADLRYFNSLEHEVDTLKSQLETQKTQFLNEIDRLSREYYYADHMNAILGIYTDLDEFTDLQCDYVETWEKCEHLEKELSKSRTMSKSFESLQKHAINLELDLQHCKEKIKHDKSFKENQSNC
ncbi:integrase, catalytic region, zinc finger, CCHC-type containing protein [Tanacetum coccineum]|uniref:Integrase, catalytic region, zinc finger, CCHC-type containing protein n=1 Tax=Tanacetum coccineum TaxID=301880 RepID=A0ABQ5GJ68_9ASTR